MRDEKSTTGVLHTNYYKRKRARHHQERLKKHSYIHGTPDPEYTCEVCGDGFLFIDEWQDHHFSEHFDQ